MIEIRVWSRDLSLTGPLSSSRCCQSISYVQSNLSDQKEDLKGHMSCE